MINNRSILLLLIFYTNSSFAAKDFYKREEIGQYYEYDMEGSRAHMIWHKLRGHAKSAAGVPFKSVRWSVGKAHRSTVAMVKSVKLFLSPSHSINGRRTAIQNALDDWERHLPYNDYRHLAHRENSVALTDIASDSWLLLKKSLYNAGVVLPRESYRTLKALIKGALKTVDPEM